MSVTSLAPPSAGTTITRDSRNVSDIPAVVSLPPASAAASSARVSLSPDAFGVPSNTKSRGARMTAPPSAVRKAAASLPTSVCLAVKLPFGPFFTMSPW